MENCHSIGQLRSLIFNCSELINMVIDKLRGQDGQMLVKFFFCVFNGRDGAEVHVLAKKRPMSSHLDQTNMVMEEFFSVEKEHSILSGHSR